MKQIFFFFILCLSFSCNNSNTQDLKEVPTGMILIKGGEFLMGARLERPPPSKKLNGLGFKCFLNLHRNEKSKRLKLHANA